MSLPFYSPQFAREVQGQSPVPALAELSEVLSENSAAFQLAEQGSLTVAMIRPNLEGCTLEPWDDATAADRIEEAISGLGIAAKFSVQFDEQAVDEFYGNGPKEIQLTLPPHRHKDFANKWTEFQALMTSGSCTVLLLHDRAGKAIETWRAQVGHYDIDNRRDPANLRGRFGKDNYNNLIHGSDAPESAIREMRILRALIERK